MAHEVSMSVPKDQVVRSDVEFTIKKNGSKLGHLHISKGNIEWWPAGNKRNKYRMSWATFAEVFEEHGRRIQE